MPELFSGFIIRQQMMALNPTPMRWQSRGSAEVEAFLKWLMQMIDHGQTEKKKPYCFLKKISHYTHQLPSKETVSAEAWAQFERSVLDVDMMDELLRDRVLNWSRSFPPMYPVAVPRDGNCLLHSAAVAIWGVDDRRHILRSLLLKTMEVDHFGSFKARWSHQRKTSLGYVASEMIDEEWADLVQRIRHAKPQWQSPAVPFAFLESIHVFVLANILQRPIIVLSSPSARSVTGQSLQENSMLGIYLPLEWSPAQCCKTPVVLAFSFQCSHFCPVLSQVYPGGPGSQLMFPLVTQDLTPLPVRFLKESEEQMAWSLFQDYLAVKELRIPDGSKGMENVLCAVLDPKPLPQNYEKLRSETMTEHGHQMSQVQQNDLSSPSRPSDGQARVSTGGHHSRSEPEVHREISAVRTGSGISRRARCVTPDCSKHAVHDGMCSSCFRNYTVAECGAALVSILDRGQKTYQLRPLQNSGAVVLNTPVQATQCSELSAPVIGNSELHLTPTAPPPSGGYESVQQMSSMMNTRCKSTNCGYRCSTKTQPYCHECYNQIMAANQSQEPTVKVTWLQQPEQGRFPMFAHDQPSRAIQESAERMSIQESAERMSDSNPHMQETTENGLPEVSWSRVLDDDIVTSREQSLSQEMNQSAVCVGPECFSPVAHPGILCESCKRVLQQSRNTHKKNVPFSHQEYAFSLTNPTNRVRTKGSSKNEEYSRTVPASSGHPWDVYGPPETSKHTQPPLRTKDLEAIHRTQIIRDTSPSATSHKKNTRSTGSVTLSGNQRNRFADAFNEAYEDVSLSVRTLAEELEEESGGFVSNLANVLLQMESKADKRRCCIAGCENFGNPEKNGLCNTCYRVYKLQEEEWIRSQWEEDVVDSAST